MIEQDVILEDPMILEPDDRYFIGYYMWTNDRITPHQVMLSSAYFAFTSLSTVGFGDLTPRSDLERAVGAIMLLAGVAFFTYIMGIFIEMIDELNSFDAEYADSEGLNSFFGCLYYLNGKKEIKKEL